jgi:hypothetical protein
MSETQAARWCFRGLLCFSKDFPDPVAGQTEDISEMAGVEPPDTLGSVKFIEEDELVVSRF